MANKKLLPFWLVPAHWGLSGKAKELARINYYHDGEEADLMSAEITYLTPYEIDKAKIEIKNKYKSITELDYRLGLLSIELNYARITKSEFVKKSLDVRFELNDISEKEYETSVIELLPDGEEKVRAALEFAYKYHDITEMEYNKELFTLRKEPWMDFNVDFNPETNEVEFSFDYNEYFWKKLKAEGHPGNDEYEIIENFIRDWGRKIATDDYSDNEDVKLVSANEGLENLPGLPEGFKSYK